MTNKKSQAEKELVITSAENISGDHDHVNIPHNPEFVEKILQGREDIKNGKGVSIDIQNLWM